MAYTQVPDPNLDVNKPGRSADWKQFRNNQDYFNTQLTTAIQDFERIRLFSHFDRRHGYATVAGVADVVCGSSSAIDTQTDYEGGQWYLSTNQDNYFNEEIGNATVTNDFHYLQLQRNQASTGSGFIVGTMAIEFDNRTVPISYKGRFKMSDNTNTIWIGFSNWPTLGTRPTDGIWLELNGTSWRFACANNSTYTNGTDFTRVTSSTWFEVEIVWDGTPQALCYVDSVLKETLTTNLPAGRRVFGKVNSTQGNADTLWIDRLEIYTSAALSDVA